MSVTLFYGHQYRKNIVLSEKAAIPRKGELVFIRKNHFAVPIKMKVSEVLHAVTFSSLTRTYSSDVEVMLVPVKD